MVLPWSCLVLRIFLPCSCRVLAKLLLCHALYTIGLQLCRCCCEQLTNQSTLRCTTLRCRAL
jgi:hypothetical protein